MLLESLQEHALEKAGGLRVHDVRIGLCYTAVELEDGNTGVAFTFRQEILPGCARSRGSLAGIPACDLLKCITAHDLIDRTVGIAAANALLNRHDDHLLSGDVLDILEPVEDDVVGMVGYFGPLVPKLKKTVRELMIFEYNTGRAPGLYPAEAAADKLPGCTIAIITSTSLINQTMEKLLDAAGNCRRTAIVGATTPLTGEVFRPCGVDIVSGVIVTDPSAILQIVSEGGGMRWFRGSVQKASIRLDSVKGET